MSSLSCAFCASLTFNRMTLPWSSALLSHAFQKQRLHIRNKQEIIKRLSMKQSFCWFLYFFTEHIQKSTFYRRCRCHRGTNNHYFIKSQSSQRTIRSSLSKDFWILRKYCFLANTKRQKTPEVSIVNVFLFDHCMRLKLKAAIRITSILLN